MLPLTLKFQVLSKESTNLIIRGSGRFVSGTPLSAVPPNKIL